MYGAPGTPPVFSVLQPPRNTKFKNQEGQIRKPSKFKVLQLASKVLGSVCFGIEVAVLAAEPEGLYGENIAESNALLRDQCVGAQSDEVSHRDCNGVASTCRLAQVLATVGGLSLHAETQP